MEFFNRFKPQLRAEEAFSATQAAKSSSKDYAKMTREELGAEEKKMNAQKIITALVIGGMVGLALWSATHHKGFALTGMLLLFAPPDLTAILLGLIVPVPLVPATPLQLAVATQCAISIWPLAPSR